MEKISGKRFPIPVLIEASVWLYIDIYGISLKVTGFTLVPV